MKFWILALCSLGLSLTTLKSQTLDAAFNPNASSTVYAVGVQPDGAILASGSFSMMGPFWRFGMARLKLDGSVDPFFNPGELYADALVIQPDGKIVIGGNYTNLAGHACTNLGRLNADGTFDPTFSASADRAVLIVMLQSDGRLLVSGVFSNLDGQLCNRIGRVNSDGSLDTTFNASADDYVRSFALQPDGKILVGGFFTNLDGEAVNYIGRLNSDGSLDHSFSSSASSSVRQILVQSNNMILVGGGFTNLAGASRACIGRLNTDGSIDPGFNPGASDLVHSMALQANGKIIVGGNFTNLAGVTRNHIGRLNPNGTLDSTFNPGANDNVYEVALQPDGKVLVGGQFTNLAGGARYFLGRLTNNDAAVQSLSFNASSIFWARSGSVPEISGARFEFSTNGNDWTFLADGTRVTGGWQATGLPIPAVASVRALGYIINGGPFPISVSVLQQIAGVPVITQQPADTETVSGSNATFTATVGGTSPLAFQWQFNGTNVMNGPKISGATNSSLVLSNVATTNMGICALIVTNSFGAVTSRLATLKIVPPTTNDFGANYIGTFYTVAAQANGKKIFGGSFSDTNGQYGLERANFSGSLDPSFRVRGASVYSVVVQPDGDIVAGGSFSTFGSPSLLDIERVHPDGSVDAAFTNKAAGPVNALALQPDGKIVFGGSFTLLGNQPHNYIGRFNADGTVDTNFNTSVDSAINTMALQANGQIIIGGNFTNVNGVVSRGLARLNTNGTLDSNFVATVNVSVTCVAAQPDGKILASLPVGIVDGELWGNLMVRLNSDGSLDTTFNAAPGSPLNTIALQADGKAFLGGSFTNFNGVSSIWYNHNLARIKSDGTTDPTFIGGASLTVYSIGIQFDGGVMVSGNFGQLYDASATSHAANASGHFKNNEEITNLLFYDSSTVRWTRTGPAPECSWVLFDSSLDGTNWSPLGQGVYTNNSWQIAGVSLPPSSIIRARGYVAGGYHNGSGWMIEARSGPPFFLMDPTGVTNGFNSTLDGWATGTPPIAYQWIKDGGVVTNYPSSQVTGAQTRSLLIKSSVGAGELGHYQLVASNAFGCVTSSVAIVSPSYPWLDSQPFTITTNAGATVSFPVTAIGFAPLSYQWYSATQPLTNGANISGATDSILALSNLTVADSGFYWVVVTNVAGTVSNLMATLNVVTLSNTPPTILSGSVTLDRVINGFGFDLTASVGQTIVIETSTNLLDWQPVFTNVVDSNPMHYHDPSAITNRNAFYRVRLQ
jgi:uncharacterized delta-60 repeat protein